MNFQSISFLAFLAVTVAICRMIALFYDWQVHVHPWPPEPVKERFVFRNSQMLAILSLIFYLFGCSEASQLGVLLAGLLVSWFAVRRMQSGKGNRRRVLILAAGWHIAVLAFYKYAAYLNGGVLTPPTIPLGLSFFTFQQLWLLAEVYRGNFTLGKEERTGFFLYGLFFPTVTSGPILKPQGFFSQLRERIILASSSDFAAGLYLICIGMAKKTLLAEGFGIIVNNGYAHPEWLNSVSAAMVVLGYTLQLYFDFSGYCDVATGCARLLGIRLPVNFNSPYRSLSVGEFWKRWHMTLTSFLRECLYFPLGGSRRGRLRAYGNILIVFLVSGLWHGTGWTFLLWGLLHGLAQVAERLLGRRLEKLPRWLRWGLTFAFVNIAWIYFRAPTVAAGNQILAQVAERLLGRRLEKLPRWLRWGLTFAFVNIAWIYFRAPTVAAGNQILGALFSMDFAKPMPWLSEGLFTCEQEVIRILLPPIALYRNLLTTAALYIVGLIAALWPRNAVAEADRFRPTFWRGAGMWLLGVWAVLSFNGIAQFIYANF